MAGRRAATPVRPGFTRYAMAIQYHGGSLLGVSYQPDQEGMDNNDSSNGQKNSSSAAGCWQSVEGRLRGALTSHNYEYDNLQISSRTDRGVHAWKNTLHVDIANRYRQGAWSVRELHRSINYHLIQGARQKKSTPIYTTATTSSTPQKNNNKNDNKEKYHHAKHRIWHDMLVRYSPMHDMRIINVQIPPPTMITPYQTEPIPWHARYSATERTYLYRILVSSANPGNNYMSYEYAVPFEWDRAWRINGPLDISAMQIAAQHLHGKHDFSSFRNQGCQRKVPVTTLYDVTIQESPAPSPWNSWEQEGGKDESNFKDQVLLPPPARIVTLRFVGNSFVFRQVRNMVGCLVAVGKGRMSSQDVYDLLMTRNRKHAPALAPAHGLFLVNVRHGDFVI